jgi:hypothetical protein
MLNKPTSDLLIKVACFVKMEIIVAFSKGAKLGSAMRSRGQLYQGSAVVEP